MRRGNVEKAKEHLLKSIKPLVSLPQKRMSTLTSFGPNLSLVKDFLEKGEWEISLEYFEYCSQFLKHPKVARWQEEIKMKKIPNFGANLVY